ncbi:hypothetical protein MMA231_01007 [Asticcacaulis sp. MM231]
MQDAAYKQTVRQHAIINDMRTGDEPARVRCNVAIISAKIWVACNVCKSFKQIITIAASALNAKDLKAVIGNSGEISFSFSA